MQEVVRRVPGSLHQAYVGKTEEIPMKNLIMFRVLITGLLAAVIVYVVPLIIFRERISVIAAAVGCILVGIVEYRRLKGKPALSEKFWVAIALCALALYAGVLLVGGVPGKPGEWAVMLAVIAIPVLVLIQIYLRRGKKGERLE
jgi:hypothetical protein